MRKGGFAAGGGAALFGPALSGFTAHSPFSQFLPRMIRTITQTMQKGAFHRDASLWEAPFVFFGWPGALSCTGRTRSGPIFPAARSAAKR